MLLTYEQLKTACQAVATGMPVRTLIDDCVENLQNRSDIKEYPLQCHVPRSTRKQKQQDTPSQIAYNENYRGQFSFL